VSVASQIRGLPPELRMAGGASAALAFTMILPWYEKSYFAQGGSRPVSANLNAFSVFTFVEAAVLVVAGGVLYLIWARSQRKAFHLPGGDGFVISAAGAWAMLLLVWRLFDKPDVNDPGATVGIQWGIFAAMVAAGALIAAGARVRAAHRPEPPNPAEENGWEEPPRRDRSEARTRTMPRDPTEVTEAFEDRPAWEGEPPDAPDRTTRRLGPEESPDAPDRPRRPAPDEPRTAAGRARSPEPREEPDGGSGEPPDRLF
jgi:hypothetical protein